MILAALVASAAVKLVPMAEPLVEPSPAEVARWEFDAAPSQISWSVPAPYPPGKGQPGYGWPSRIEDYEVGGDLAEKLAKYPGLEAHWFVREPLACADVDAARRIKSYSDSIPFLLFRPKPCPCRWWNPFSWFGSDEVPLVVYLPGNGEQGTDLVKQFRQVGVIGRVVGDEFQDDHRAWLLVPMPPEKGDRNIPSGYPVQPRAPLVTLYDDLVLKVVELSRADGEAAPPIDERRIYLTGLGTGGTVAAAMSFDHPGRYAVTAAAWARPHHQPVLHPDAPGDWWFGYEEKMYADALANNGDFYEKFWGKFRADAEQFGGSLVVRTYPKGGHACWWDAMWESDEFWSWCFEKESNGEVEVKK